MSAKEMFEEIKYELQTKEQLKLQQANFNKIRYLRGNNECIDFYLDFEQIACFMLKTHEVMGVTMSEFKAIQKQIEELGWNE